MPPSVVTREDFEAMRIAVNVAMSEAAERQMDLSVADITVRLLDAYLMGDRDPTTRVLFLVSPRRHSGGFDVGQHV